MNNHELVFLSAANLASQIRNKQISPVEAVEAYLQQINRVDPKLNAYITVLADQALEAARESESDITSGINRGPLHGVPVAVKDQIYTKGIRTSSASKIRSNFVPDFDASVVTGLKSSGAIILGKLNMTEFAMGDPITSAFGVTRNPWDIRRNPGTSSTGSGAATGCQAGCGRVGLAGPRRGPAAGSHGDAKGPGGRRPTGYFVPRRTGRRSRIRLVRQGGALSSSVGVDQSGPGAAGRLVG